MELIARFYMVDGSLFNLVADGSRQRGKVEHVQGSEANTLMEGSYAEAFEFFVGKSRESKTFSVEQNIVSEVTAVEAEEVAETAAMSSLWPQG